VKYINGFPSYYVLPEGQVFSHFQNKLMKQHNNNGYKMVFLCNPATSVRKWQYIHRLVAEYYVVKPQTKKKLWVNHMDGNKANNHYTNLEWSTIQENIRHALDTGLIKPKHGSEHHNYGKVLNPNGRPSKWIYAMPSGARLTYKELIRVFGATKAHSITAKCRKKCNGYNKIAI